jgi:hypothetical protein
MGPLKRTPLDTLRHDVEMESAIRKALNELIAYSKRTPEDRAAVIDSASLILAEAMLVHMHTTRNEPPCPAAPPSPPPFSETPEDAVFSAAVAPVDCTPSKKRSVREPTASSSASPRAQVQTCPGASFNPSPSTAANKIFPSKALGTSRPVRVSKPSSSRTPPDRRRPKESGAKALPSIPVPAKTTRPNRRSPVACDAKGSSKLVPRRVRMPSAEGRQSRTNCSGEERRGKPLKQVVGPNPKLPLKKQNVSCVPGLNDVVENAVKVLPSEEHRAVSGTSRQSCHRETSSSSKDRNIVMLPQVSTQRSDLEALQPRERAECREQCGLEQQQNSQGQPEAEIEQGHAPDLGTSSPFPLSEGPLHSQPSLEVEQLDGLESGTKSCQDSGQPREPKLCQQSLQSILSDEAGCGAPDNIECRGQSTLSGALQQNLKKSHMLAIPDTVQKQPSLIVEQSITLAPAQETCEEVGRDDFKPEKHIETPLQQRSPPRCHALKALSPEFRRDGSMPELHAITNLQQCSSPSHHSLKAPPSPLQLSCVPPQADCPLPPPKDDEPNLGSSSGYLQMSREKPIQLPNVIEKQVRSKSSESGQLTVTSKVEEVTRSPTSSPRASLSTPAPPRKRPRRNCANRPVEFQEMLDASKYVSVPAKKRKFYELSSPPNITSVLAVDQIPRAATGDPTEKPIQNRCTSVNAERSNGRLGQLRKGSLMPDFGRSNGADTDTDEDTIEMIPWWQQAANRNMKSKIISPIRSEVKISSLFRDFISALTWACVTEEYASTRLLDSHTIDSSSVGGGVYSVVANVLGMLDYARNTEQCAAKWSPELISVLQQRPNLCWAPIEYDPSFVQFVGCEVCIRHCFATRYLWANGEQYDPRSYWPEACLFEISSFTEIPSGGARAVIELVDARGGPESAFSKQNGGGSNLGIDIKGLETEEFWTDKQCLWRCMLYHELSHSVTRVASAVRELVVEALKKGVIEVPPVQAVGHAGDRVQVSPRERIENHLVNEVLLNNDFMQRMIEWLEDAYNCGLKHLRERAVQRRVQDRLSDPNRTTTDASVLPSKDDHLHSVGTPEALSIRASGISITCSEEESSKDLGAIEKLVQCIPLAEGASDSLKIPDIFDSETEPDYDEHHRKFVSDVISRSQQTCPLIVSQTDGG